MTHPKVVDRLRLHSGYIAAGNIWHPFKNTFYCSSMLKNPVLKSVSRRGYQRGRSGLLLHPWRRTPQVKFIVKQVGRTQAKEL